MTGGRVAELASSPPETAVWRLRRVQLELDRPRLLGVLNVTPDSFSDAGRFADPGAAAERAHAMADEGADLIDIGAESSRPGASPVPAESEWVRLEPVLSRLHDLSVPISVDTTKAEIARRAVELGASAINDISALRFEPELADVAAEAGAGLILMHMRGEPGTMQDDVEYSDLLREVRSALGRAIEEAERRGCAPSQIVVDPGIGFGKSLNGNLELLARVGELAALGRPILVGPSRKSFLGRLLGLPVDQRVEGTIAACVMALTAGARLFRVHDVRAARRALDVADAILKAGPSTGQAAPTAAG